ncbi:hypothetical protein BSL78_27957 [Apostichopus japonicus]|uniref:Uncharacterized protein n=1 Tax=Stichopus japonicus TaxID=307972 RepID=A0A2G8JHJ7_STIJA|nr:hypothetical protein BSL78_27957 [Apostichopus japonicus]
MNMHEAEQDQSGSSSDYRFVITASTTVLGLAVFTVVVLCVAISYCRKSRRHTLDHPQALPGQYSEFTYRRKAESFYWRESDPLTVGDTTPESDITPATDTTSTSYTTPAAYTTPASDTTPAADTTPASDTTPAAYTTLAAYTTPTADTTPAAESSVINCTTQYRNTIYICDV